MTVEVPLLISVDDHVVEPPDLWQRWWPQRHREAGPKVVSSGYEVTSRLGGQETVRQDPSRAHEGRYRMVAEGPRTDFWVYEGVAVATMRIMAVAGLSADEISHDPISSRRCGRRCTTARPGWPTWI